LDTTPQEQVAFLKAKYGNPTEDKITTYQNGFGAIWQCPEPKWINADGEGIIAHGSTSEGHRYRHVLFGTAEQSETSPKKNRSETRPIVSLRLSMKRFRPRVETSVPRPAREFPELCNGLYAPSLLRLLACRR
jgi:hypothetical protein